MQRPLHPRTLVALVRHGEPSDYGATSTDVALSARGSDQARAARAYLAPLRGQPVLSSPAPRAVATAQILSPDAPVVPEPRLAGLRLDAGDEGPIDTLAQMEAVFADPEAAPFGGEALGALSARVQPVVSALLGSGNHAVAVGHRVVNVVALAHVLGLPLADAAGLQQDTGAINLVERRRSSDVVAGINLTPTDPLFLSPGSRTLPDSQTPVDRRLYVVRHGESTNVADDGALVRIPPATLTARGRVQAETVGALLRPLVSRVYASDIARAAETAAGLAGGAEVVLERGLREIGLGQADGTSVQELFGRYPDYLSDPDIAPPGGESSRAAAERGATALARILEHEDSETVVLVGHGGINRALVGRLLGWSMAAAFRVRCDFASVTVLDYAAGRWWLRGLNWTPGGVEDLWRLRPIAELDDRHAALVGR